MKFGDGLISTIQKAWMDCYVKRKEKALELIKRLKVCMSKQEFLWKNGGKSL